MGAINYNITFSAGAQLELSAGINAAVVPLLNQAVRAVAQQTAAEWKKAVYQAKLWSGEKDAYAQSITWKMTGDFSAYIEADYKLAAEIESGRPARDLKKMLLTSTKVRRTKDGRRFLVIPMRHKADSLPATVQATAKTLTASRITATGQRPSGQVTHLSPRTGMQPAAKQTPFLSNVASRKPQMVASRTYSWGSSISAAALRQAGADSHTIARYKGMVRMDTSTNSKAKSSSLLTFRIMMEGSTGWVVPPKPGLYIARNVSQQMEPKAVAAFQEAVKRLVKI